MKFFATIWDRISGRAAARKMLDEFLVRFPGKCPICAYHRYGLQYGHTSEVYPPKHEDCPEGRGRD